MTTTTRHRRPPLGFFPGQAAPRLYDRIVQVLRVRHYSRRTEEAYVHWIRRYIEFHEHRHPRQLAEGDVNRFLTHLAVKEHVAASTQNQALSAILFLYEHVLAQPLDRIEGVVRARRPKRLPVVLTVDEVSRVMAHLTGDKWLIAMLLYGGRLRLLESLRLRVKDLDFQRGEITVREGKGDKDRVTTMPQGSGSSPPGTSSARANDSPARPGRWLRACRTARFLGSQVPKRQPRVVLAIRVPAGTPLAKLQDRRAGASSHRRIAVFPVAHRCGAQGRSHEARHELHISPLVRHTPAGRRV